MNKLESLQSIFKESIFKIPDYQRGYAWKKEQLTDFWEDLVNLPEGAQHYTGMLSLKIANQDELTSGNGWRDERWLINDRNFKPYYVVDGQQRLTTFIIFINSLISLVRSLPENHNKSDADIFVGSRRISDIVDDFLMTSNPRDLSVKSYRFSYESDNPSFSYMRYSILGSSGGGEITETFYTLNLENAKNFFTTNLKSYYENYGIESLEELFKKLTQNLRFNLHEIEDNFDVFVAFETMNNRGKKLSNLELLKNRLIYLTTLFKDTDLVSIEHREVMREKINDAWKEIYFNLGRRKDQPLSDDEFLRAHWIMYFTYTRKKGSDYADYLLGSYFVPQSVYGKKGYVDSIANITELYDEDPHEEKLTNDEVKEAIRHNLTPRLLTDYVDSLRETASVWYFTHNPYENQHFTDLEKKLITKLNRVGIAYFRPLVVAIFMNKNMSTNEREELLAEIERFIFLAFRVSRYLSSYKSSEFNRLAKDLYLGNVGPKDIGEAISTALQDLTDTDGYFKAASFIEKIDMGYKYAGGFYGWGPLTYFLYEYENYLSEKSGNEQKVTWESLIKKSKTKVSIEHVYPQTPKDKYWVERFNMYSEDQRKYLNGSLGNLVTLSQQKNASLQNDPFPQKCISAKDHNGYHDGSHSEIEISKYTEWSPATIKSRGIEMLDFMQRNWRLEFKDSDKINILHLAFMENEA